jgi:hypothetical protein
LLLKAIRISARKQITEPAYPIEEARLLKLASELVKLAETDSNSSCPSSKLCRWRKTVKRRRVRAGRAMEAATVKA